MANTSNWADWSLRHRLLFYNAFIGVPLFGWEMWDFWRNFRDNPFIGTPETLTLVSIALGFGFGTATMAAFVEHLFFSVAKKWTRRP